jgi:hypothetical protein
MAWIAPRTWVNGELVNASLLNTHVRDNMLETAVAKVTTAGDIVYATAANALARLGIGTAGQVLGISAGVPSWVSLAGGEGETTAVTISGTVETEIFSKSITLDTNDLVALEIMAVINDSPSGATVTAKVYADATLLLTALSQVARGDGADDVHNMKLTVQGTGTNAQRLCLTGYGMSVTPVSFHDFQIAETGTAAIAWTSAKALKVKITLSNGSLNFRKYNTTYIKYSV